MDIDAITQRLAEREGTLTTLSGPGFPLYLVELDGQTYGPLIEREVVSLVEAL